MAQTLIALVIALPVGGFALLSHWGKKDRGAEIALFVLLVFSSLLVTGVGALIFVAGFAAPVPRGLTSTPLLLAAASIVTFAGLAGIALCTPPLWSILGRAARGFWSNPPVFFALWLFVMVLSLSLVGFIGFIGTEPGTLSSSVDTVSAATVIANAAPYLIVAVLGVGLWVRRSPREVVARLGYGSLGAAQLGICALFVVGALALSVGADRIFAALQPGLHERVGKLSSELFSTQGMGLGSVLLFGLLLGIGAALGEESLFRGAVQPALGILPTSLLFAALHTQYGPSVSIVYILFLSIGLGVLRKRINTSAAFVTHAAYNFLGVLLAHFSSGGF